jgi:hypothetical protein
MIGTIVTVGIVILAFFIAGAVFGYIGLMALSVRREEKRKPRHQNPPNQADPTPDRQQGPGGAGDPG